MRKFRFVLLCSILLLTAVLMLACGTSNRQLQSIIVSPVAATSQAQFTATGIYTDGSKVTPLAVMWFPGPNPWSMGVAAEPITLDAQGMASCLTFTGTYSVDAFAPVDPSVPISKIGPTIPLVRGEAQLTCP